MSEIHNTLNFLLVKLFNDIMKIEQQMLITDEFKDISITDMHVIEAIGYDCSKSMSAVAKNLGITTGTLTIAINNLVKKDYVKRVRSVKDRRVVLISLTAKGEKAYKHHKNFHNAMIEEIRDLINEEEEKVLLKTLTSINKYFSKKLD